MHVYTTLNIVAFHTNHCEDFLVNEPLATNHHLIAVMDGCTMGKESVFASILVAKILRKIARGHFYQELFTGPPDNLKALLQTVLKQLFDELRTHKNALGLETNELLTTLILGVVHTGPGPSPPQAEGQAGSLTINRLQRVIALPANPRIRSRIFHLRHRKRFPSQSMVRWLLLMR